MAVEIPVVVDIEGAFQDAARRVPKAVEPLKKSLEGLSEDLSFWQEQLGKAAVGSADFKLIAKEIQNITQAMDIANKEFEHYGSNEGSIRRLSNELAFLSDQWEKMGAQQKYTANGELSDEAKALLDKYKKITEELGKSGKTLAQMEAEEKRLLDLAKKRQDAVTKAAQKRKYENAILSTNVKTIRILTEQERILSEKISNKIIGSDKYNALAASLQKVRKELAEARAQIDGTSSSMNKMGASTNKAKAAIDATNVSLGKQSALFSQIKSIATMYVSVFGAIRLVHNIRETTAELEMQRVALGGIVQDTAIADKLFRQIKAAALKSPFEIKDLVTYTKQLSAYRVETDKLFDVTMRLADVSAGLGVDMNRLILAYGQVRAASVLRGQELRQFTEAGIPLVDLLAKKFQELGREGTTTADVFELISKRAVPFSMIEEIFNDMTSAGEIFYNMQEKQSETLKGQWMKLRDAITIMYDEIGNTSIVNKAMKGLISDLLSLTNSWKETARWIGVALTSMMTYSAVAKASAVASAALTKVEAARLALTKTQAIVMPKFIAGIIGETAAKNRSIIATKRLTVAQYRLATATTVAERAFWKLWAAIIKNPYALAVAAIAALAGSIYALVKNSKEAEVSADSLQKSLSGLENQAKKTGDVNRLIGIYNELADKADRTKEEQEKLARATRELAKAFPSAVSGIDKETDSLKINIQKVEELTKAELKLKEAKLEGEAKRAEERIAELEKEREKILSIAEIGGKYVKGPGGADMFIPLTQKQWDEYSKRIEEINKELDDLKGTAEDVNDALFIGPLPDTSSAAKKSAKVWKETLEEIQKEKVAAGAPTIFTPDDIEKLEDVEDLYKKWKKGIEDAKTSLAGLKALQETLTDPGAISSNLLSITQLEKEIELWQTIADKFGFKEKSKTTGGYKQDPFIAQMQNRMKFMQDFKKGYEDLRKYISDSGALDEEMKIMEGRGRALGLDISQQKRAAEDLSAWYQEMIDLVSNKLRAKGVSGVTVTDLLGFDTSKRSKDVQDFQKLLQSLWDAKTDFDTSEMKKNFEEAMTKMKDEIKRSETVRNFYNDILGITGDEDIAATMSVSVYGGLGNDFRENLQKELNAAFASLSTVNQTDALRKAFDQRDFDTILKNMDKFPEEWQKRLREMATEEQKFNADLAKGLLQALEKSKSYAAKRVEIAQQTARRMEQIEQLSADETVKAELRKQNAKKEAEDVAKLQYEAFKETPMYVELFANLDRASTTMLRNMRDNIVKMKSQWKDLAPTEMKELQSRIAELDRQLAVKNPFRALAEGIREYRELYKTQTREQADTRSANLTDALNAQRQSLDLAAKMYETTRLKYGVDSLEAKAAKKNLDIQKKKTDEAEKAANEAQETANAYRIAAKHISDAAEALETWSGYVSTSLGGINEIVSTFASDDIADTFNIISGGIEKTIGGTAKLLAGASMGLAGIPQMIAGLGEIIGGIFGTAQQLQIKKANKEIDRQAKTIETLEYQYGRLEKAIEKAFGSDYITNYNQQLANLAAQQEAYLKQAEAERSKGKKADEDKIKDYENSAREAADKILDMQSQLSEFFSGTDLTSAAKDFANSWIEAYKEFGSTTVAMREKFQEMVQEMVEKSLAAKVMQQLLEPIFTEIDRLAQEGGELSVADIAAIAKMADEQIPNINEAMLTLMNTLTQAGYNLRSQPGQFTGIARNIANASEESITGLAAGINTQNYYMSYMPTISANVAAILTYITGGAAQTTGGTMITPTNGELMMAYMSTIPTINDNLVELIAVVKSVVTPKNLATNTNVVAVRN